MHQGIKRLVHFEKWADPVCGEILATRPDIRIACLRFDAPEADTWAEMTRAHGYQIAGRTELRDPWFANPALIARCPDLLAISSLGAGFDMIDVDACTAAGIVVVNQSGSNFEAVAEHALGMMIVLSKKIVQSHAAMKRNSPPGQLDRWSFTGNDIWGKTVGIVGLGNIGRRTAELCHAFRMNVLACDPYLSEEEIKRRGACKVTLDELIARSDFITLHCPRTPETLNMFGAAQFAAMKPNAFFIDTARGGTYDEMALDAALGKGQLAGAGLDVFIDEPPAQDHPLLWRDNVIASPHNAGMTWEALENMARMTADQWFTLFDGGIPPRMVNPAAWPLYSQRFERIFGRRPQELPA